MENYNKLDNPVALAIFLLTLFLPVLVGLLVRRKTRNQSDFFVGGRAMDKFVVALSAVSSGRSSWLVLGVSGIAYYRGVGAVWAVVGYILVEMFQFIYIGKKLRAQTESFKSMTILDFFESRLNDGKHIIRAVGALIIAVFMILYVTAQMKAGSVSLSSALNIPVPAALLVSGTLLLIYMVLGGYIAVAYNDVIRAVIMIISLVVFPVVGLIKIGGLSVLLHQLSASDAALVDPFSLGLGMITGYLAIGLGSPGQPHIVVRYMSINDPDKLRFSAVVGTFWNVTMAWGALFIGLIGRVTPGIRMLTTPKEAELIYLILASKYFGPIFYSVLIGGVFAAILSTADSQLLVLSSTFVRDLYEKIVRKNHPIEENFKLKLSRVVVIVSGLLAMLIAYFSNNETIFWLVLFAWGGLGASLGSALIMILYWKRTTIAGITAGMVTGTVISIVWRLFLKEVTGVWELIPAFFGALFVIFCVSLFTKLKD